MINTLAPRLLLGDCLERMAAIKDGSVDLILTDPPYGSTNASWDAVIPFPEMWSHIDRVSKTTASAVLFGSQLFTTKLISSNMKNFRYCWIWKKNQSTGFFNAKKRPLISTEDIMVFCRQTPPYNPQGVVEMKKPIYRGPKIRDKNGIYKKSNACIQTRTNYPTNILKFKKPSSATHPSAKPVDLLEYLILTYTQPCDTVLDFTMGSGSTGVACNNTGRQFIGIERDTDYFNMAAMAINRPIVSFDLSTNHC